MLRSFDILIIGKGLVGSAAAKYLAQSGKKVAVIGPDEPEDYNKATVYASHYDEARVQRIIGKDDVWTKLNYDSVKQYASIETESGVRFHSGLGCLYINRYGKDAYLKEYPSAADKLGLEYELVGEGANKFVKGFEFPDTVAGVFEFGPSGFINPRQLVSAQLKILSSRGGVIIRDTVVSVRKTNGGDFSLQAESGQVFRAKQVLVATGSFLNHLNVLPEKVKLINKSEVVLLVQIKEEELPKYSKLPSLLYELDENDTEGIYLLPPVKYPDGNYYLKIGANSPWDIYFDNLSQIQEWFRGTSIDQFKAPLVNAVKNLLPSLNLETVVLKKCIISRTTSGRPYIGESSLPGLFIAGGCNGYSAMCSDAMGSVASSLVLNGVFPEGYPRDAFSVSVA